MINNPEMKSDKELSNRRIYNSILEDHIEYMTKMAAESKDPSRMFSKLELSKDLFNRFRQHNNSIDFKNILGDILQYDLGYVDIYYEVLPKFYLYIEKWFNNLSDNLYLCNGYIFNKEWLSHWNNLPRDVKESSLYRKFCVDILEETVEDLRELYLAAEIAAAIIEEANDVLPIPDIEGHISA